MTKSGKRVIPRPDAVYLQAVGALALAHSDLEATMLKLFLHHLIRNGIPDKLARKLYGGLSDSNKIGMIVDVFEAYEQRSDVTNCIARMTALYKGCASLRNSIVHAYYAPPLFGGDTIRLLYLEKLGRKSMAVQYAKPSKRKLAESVGAIEKARETAANLLLFLTIRDTPQGKQGVTLRSFAAFGYEKLPSIPRPPSVLRLKDIPHTPLMPQYLLLASSR